MKEMIEGNLGQVGPSLPSDHEIWPIIKLRPEGEIISEIEAISAKIPGDGPLEKKHLELYRQYLLDIHELLSNQLPIVRDNPSQTQALINRAKHASSAMQQRLAKSEISIEELDDDSKRIFRIIEATITEHSS